MVECAGKRILIDCGLYQGGREMDEENAEPFGFDPAAIDMVLLTHAHLDHCGRLPLLVKRGFRGEIVTTAAARELGEPLYTILDAMNSLEYFGRTAHYNQPVELAPGLRATFLDAGHILGSASIYLEETGADACSVLFSGDLGNAGRPLLRNPVTPATADVVVMETTYGDRSHKQLKPSVDELYDAIDDTFHRGGNVVIPTFALERAQELLYYLREGIESGRLPRTMQVFLDSPMAISATQIFEHHPECYGAGTAELFREGRDPFGLPGLHFTRDTADSIALNRIGGGAVIMAGSGLCIGGRVRHHLKHTLWRHDCAVVFVGYAARGTLAPSTLH